MPMRLAEPGALRKVEEANASVALVARHDVPRRVLDAVAHNDELDRRSHLVESAVDRIRKKRGVTKRGNQDRGVGHAAPASRRSSSSVDTIAAPSAALDLGAGPPRTCSTNALSCARSGSSPGVSMRVSS